MWNLVPGTIRKLFGIPPVDRYPQAATRPWEWPLYAMARYRLGIDLDVAYRLIDGGPMPRHYRYRHLTVPKKDGTLREIVEPGKTLKVVQRKILKLYLGNAKPHPAALGFRRKKSIADHAWAHAGAATIITADIEDFFPNTTRQRVKSWWHSQGYSTLEARLLTSLTTYRGALPQGAPTSPPLSNLVNFEMDAALDRRSKQNGGSYTRYSDDMVFSWPDHCDPPADFEQAVRSVLREYGYALHPRKGWNVWQRRDEPQVTGVVLTRQGRVDIPDSMRRVMRTLLYSDNPHDQARLTGYRGYESMVKTPPRPTPAPRLVNRRQVRRL